MYFTLFQTLIIYLWFQYDFLQEMLRRIFMYEFMDVSEIIITSVIRTMRHDGGHLHNPRHENLKYNQFVCLRHCQ
jgi:hypothetical protein